MRIVLLLSSIALVSSGVTFGQVLYTVDYDTGDLYAINVRRTGQSFEPPAILIGNTGVQRISGLDYRPSDNRLYALQTSSSTPHQVTLGNDPVGFAQVWRINPYTAEAEPIGAPIPDTRDEEERISTVTGEVWERTYSSEVTIPGALAINPLRPNRAYLASRYWDLYRRRFDNDEAGGFESGGNFNAWLVEIDLDSGECKDIFGGDGPRPKGALVFAETQLANHRRYLFTFLPNDPLALTGGCTFNALTCSSITRVPGDRASGAAIAGDTVYAVSGNEIFSYNKDDLLTGLSDAQLQGVALLPEGSALPVFSLTKSRVTRVPGRSECLAVRPGSLYALLIGVDHYTFFDRAEWPFNIDDFMNPFPKLSGSGSIKDLGEKLQAFQMYAESTPLVFDYTESPDSSSIEKVLEAVRAIEQKVKPGDQFIFYIASHGGSGTLDENGKLTPGPFRGAGDEWVALHRGPDPRYKLIDDQLTEAFDTPTWDEVNKLFIIDACFGGGFATSFDHPTEREAGEEADLLSLPRSAVLSPASEYLTTASAPGLGGVLFCGSRTQFACDLIEGLELVDGVARADTDADGLSFEDLAAYLNGLVEEKGSYEGYIQDDPVGDDVPRQLFDRNPPTAAKTDDYTSRFGSITDSELTRAEVPPTADPVYPGRIPGTSMSEQPEDVDITAVEPESEQPSVPAASAAPCGVGVIPALLLVTLTTFLRRPTYV